jgi:UDP-3-O-[3-hydroxymyristoyl] glucosamine N-acyltransferase
MFHSLAIIGDRMEICCNAVINPGSVVGRDCMIYRRVNLRGVLASNSIVKTQQTTQVLSRRSIGLA